MNKKTLDERINSMSEILVQQPPDILYHYTTGHGFLGIIREKEIWATSILYMNDAKEFALSFDITLEKIENKKQEFRNNEDISRLLDRMDKNLRSIESINVYVVSFSKNNNQLSQWRAYSGDYGFCIGFRKERLVTLAGQKFYLKPCIYCHSEQENIIEEIINFHIEDFQAKSIGSGNIIDIVFLKFLEDIVKYSPIIKHKSFEEECEWRLISRLTYDDGSIVIPVTDKNMAYRSGKSMIIPYFKFKLCGNDGNFNIAEVWVGPTLHALLQEKAADELLTRYGIVDFVDGKTKPVDIFPSSIPLRNWK